MPEPLEAKVVDPKAFSESVKSFKIGNYLQAYPKPSLSAQGIPVKLEHSLPLSPAPEKSKPIPFSAILPITNTFINSDGRAFTEPALGFGISAPLPIKDTGAFAIVSNNTNGASTVVAGAGWVPIHKQIGDFQANLGASGVMVCVEHGNREKIAPNPHIGTCGLFPSIYSSVRHIPSGIFVQAIVTPALTDNQDNVVTVGAGVGFKNFLGF